MTGGDTFWNHLLAQSKTPSHLDDSDSTQGNWRKLLKCDVWHLRDPLYIRLINFYQPEMHLVCLSASHWRVCIEKKAYGADSPSVNERRSIEVTHAKLTVPSEVNLRRWSRGLNAVKCTQNPSIGGGGTAKVPCVCSGIAWWCGWPAGPQKLISQPGKSNSPSKSP